MRASDYHRPPSAIDPNQIVATRTIGGRTLQVLDVGDHRYRLTENGTILHPGIDPWATDSPRRHGRSGRSYGPANKPSPP